MKRFALLILAILVFTATSAYGQSRKHYTVMNGTAGAQASIAGVSMGPYDRLTCQSGTTIEWYYVVTSGVSDIWPPAGGGISGWRRSDVSGETAYFNVIFINGVEPPTSAQVTSWVQSHVSQYPYASQVTSWIISGTSPFGSVTSWVTNATSAFATGDFDAGVSTPGVSIYHNTIFDKTPLFITTDQDGIAGITVQATPHNAKIGIAIVNDSATWRIVNDGADGGTLKFYKANTLSAELDSASFSAPAITSTGNVIGTSIYSYDTSGVDGIGGLFLYTKAVGGNYVLIKIPGDGALLSDYTLTLPVTTGASSQALLNDGTGQLTWGSPTASETDTAAFKALATHTSQQYLHGTSGYAFAAGTSAHVAALTGASVISGASMTVNQNACSIGAAFSNAGSGESVFITVPYNKVLTGASYYVCVTGAANGAGVSIAVGSAVGAIPTSFNGNQKLFDLSNNGVTQQSKSGTTSITAGYIINIASGTVPTGASTWTVQIFGRKE